MALTKLGLYVEQINIRNEDGFFGEADVRGLSTQKQYTETKANLDGVNLRSYKLFAPGNFAYVPDTSRRGDKVSLAFNDSESTFLVSSISIVFRVSDLMSLCPEYLFMYFNRPEFDRYARYNSWGSARETFNWEDMCDIEIDLPDIGIQRKYAAIYSAMLENQRCYERGLDDLKLACDASIEKVMKDYPHVPLKGYINQSDVRNDFHLDEDSVRGISIEKKFISTKANMDGVSLSNYKMVKPGSISFVTVTSRNSEKLTIALNDSDDTYLVSATYVVFSCKEEHVLPEYLMLLFSRSEFDRRVRFNSWGSARETFNWEDMEDIELPLPPMKIQQALANIYQAYVDRKKTNEILKQEIKSLCPILIKGSVEEASR